MKERPILFSGSMVRAILDGRKTQTRRVVKPQPFIDERGNVAREETRRGKTATWLYGQHPDGRPQWQNFADMCCPYGRRGDRLWVREAFMPRPGLERISRPNYRADNDRPEWRGLWKPSIHMPRRASRITLEIVAVRVEPLNEISAEDAFAEGIRFTMERRGPGGSQSGWGIEGVVQGNGPQHAYSLLWEHINGAGSWDANPWVWVVEFKRLAAAEQAEAAE